ncbi:MULTISPECIES: hypothetical protein [Lacrimispora]|uniref:Uncharacterized protein n=1 Tax=Lacrimispora celerecrescens TaxID=29354 RepID=A0A084JFU8_9FIRM|nr:hypothetical protein [Lacrimispora celerecrescens]KEZ87832.1 hypothetical protein IO98_20370 [Lacrimispora celerecrescens]
MEYKEGVAWLIRYLGFFVVGQLSGAKAALEFIKSNPVDMIVSDIISSIPGHETRIEFFVQINE